MLGVPGWFERSPRSPRWERLGPGPAQKEGQSLPAMLRPLASSASRMVPAWSATAETLKPRGSQLKVLGADERRL